ncbi:MAG: hypothetical protein QOH51_653 [Acidobacteriota bacterium]|jgi:hypothetical protein|nr:hypothetical protein [Acidobacteriota bacterium]
MVMKDNRTRNKALMRYVLLPTIFLTVALLGGVRVEVGSGAIAFLPPPLVTLVMTAMLMSMFVRGRLVQIGRWLSEDNTALVNVSHALTLASLFFASAQAFNSVLPEAGLTRKVFSFFFVWTLWHHQFFVFDARRLLRSLMVLFGTAFVVKHLLLASLYAPGGGWLRRLAGAALEGLTLGTIDERPQSLATGYICFFTLALYVLGLALVPPAPGVEGAEAAGGRVLEALRGEDRASLGMQSEVLEVSAETVDASPEIKEESD